jgi:branched-chain amino acid transport system ATP-binding protein
MFALNKVSAGYGSSVVLRDVTLKVPDGAVVALLGANGAGKTTLLRVASGIIKPMSGSMTLDGNDVTGWRPHRLVGAGVCHVPEGRGIFPNLSVRDNLRMQIRSGSVDESMEKVIKLFPVLGRRMAQLAGTMSGGEQQMLALSRSYVQNPRLCLLDEVSMGLAPVIVDEIFAFLELLADEGSSMLLVEQYVTRALAIADYVYLLNRGEVRFCGEPTELDSADIFKEYVGADVGH